MKILIKWLPAGPVQEKTLVRCHTKQGEFTMNSPIYQAIEDGSFIIKCNGEYKFEVFETK